MYTLSSLGVRSLNKLRNISSGWPEIRLVRRGLPARLVLAWILAALLSASLLRPEVKAVYNSGDLDLSFGVGGKVVTNLSGGNDYALGVALQPDGKIVAVGHSNADFVVTRHNSDGSLDQTFGLNGIVTTDFFHYSDVARDVVVQPNGKIVVAGFCIFPTGSSGADARFALARYKSDGNLDKTFSTAGKVSTNLSSGDDKAFNLALQPDGKIVVAGEYHRQRHRL